MLLNLTDSKEYDVVPTRMGELTEPEGLLIRSYRWWVAGMRLNDDKYWGVAWKSLSAAIADQCTKEVLGGLQSVIAGICSSARRPTRLHPPCCCFVCPDELQIVHLIGACQRRNHSLARSTAEWMVSGDGMANLIDGGRRIAAVLTRKALVLPDRSHRGFVEARRADNTEFDSKSGELVPGMRVDMTHGKGSRVV